MSTIASHLAVATVLVVSHAGHFRPSAVASYSKSAPRQTDGAIGLVFMIILVALLVTMARAARGLAALISGFLQVAASITSVLLGMLIVVVIAVALLVQH